MAFDGQGQPACKACAEIRGFGMSEVFDPSAVIGLSANIVFRKVGDGGILLDTKSGQIHTCNETSQAFLAGVDGKRSISAIMASMLEEYDVSAAVLESDIAELVARLAGDNIVILDDGKTAA